MNTSFEPNKSSTLFSSSTNYSIELTGPQVLLKTEYLHVRTKESSRLLRGDVCVLCGRHVARMHARQGVRIIYPNPRVEHILWTFNDIAKHHNKP